MTDRPTAADLEAGRAEMAAAWCLRVPHLCAKGNPYALDQNPFNRLDVQVLSWSKMTQRTTGPVVTEPLKRIVIEGRGIRVVEP